MLEFHEGLEVNKAVDQIKKKIFNSMYAINVINRIEMTLFISLLIKWKVRLGLGSGLGRVHHFSCTSGTVRSQSAWDSD